ncbi:putative receptor-like protein kinase At3g47110 [Euphorbia lathyris]|uniref:putative receptor-like protein kinase At3g47110 n=1 Tax=Euphorbia lathyris TaxID=212925 RepID=UPI0033142DA1
MEFCGFTNLLMVICCCISISISHGSSLGNVTDRLALLDFKNLITHDPLQIMTSWNDSVHFCNWTGVSCNPIYNRVQLLNLKSLKLTGSIPPSIANLTYLTGINFINNSFSGQLPQHLGRLLRLQHLNLTYNSFTGKIPTNLTHCKQLTVIECSYNNLVGDIPVQLRSLSNLVVLGLGGNNLTGTIPSWIGNFSNLFGLSLALNNFHGNIPDELGKLSGLGFFQLYGNYLTGTVPSSIYNLSSIYYFSVTQNQLHGQLPADIGLKFPSLRVFAGGVNNFTGSIPVSLANASALEVIDFAQNALTGTIPTNLQRLQSLYRLNFDENNLGNWEIGGLNFLTSLSNCTSLEVLGLGRNRFGGELPSSIGNLSTQLKILTIGKNGIHGSIPVEIENLVNLGLLGFEGNLLTGNVPAVIGKLQKLEGLHLNYNRFSGSIPSSLGNLTRLTRLFMEENRFGGSIPATLGNCKNLQNLNLSSNNLNGSIPKEVIGLSSLSISLVMSNNALTGSIPFEVGKLDTLTELDLSENQLSGEIPTSLGSCISLEVLHLEGNEFEGTIPESLKDLRGVAEVDLSRNNLSGKIPEFLSKLLSLRNLNLSYNDFEGEIPEGGIFANTSAISVMGNAKLCGEVLPKCSSKKKPNSLIQTLVILATLLVIFVIVAVCSVAIFIERNSRKKHQQASAENWQAGISFAELKRATDGFSEQNLIGFGSFGSVYKGVIDGKTVAVKVMKLEQKGASKSFVDECNALRNIRHRNLLKIITLCSAVDDHGNDFKALVFEFMSNGSLDEWLHNNNNNKRLNFIQRLNIAIDIGCALDYLHHDCETSIVHCDLKPSNVLVDEDMTGHVGDFGLAKFLFQDPLKDDHVIMSVGLKGSIGYIPPEYGVGGEVSIVGDAYSYGILLLEMFTGKRPTDEMFKGDLTIHNYVGMALPEHAMDVIDPILLVEEEEDDEIQEKAIIHGGRINLEEYIISVMTIGLSCSSRLPENRLGMDLVVNKLHHLKNSFLGSNKTKKIIHVN